MNRRSMAVSCRALGLVLACLTAGCGTSSSSTTARHGIILTMVNHTSVTVTMKSCPANTPQALQCSAVSTVGPGGSAEFPWPGSTGHQARQVVIGGYGRQLLCFLIPPNSLPKNVLADVTQSQQSMCTGP